MGDAAQWGNTLHHWKESGDWGNTSPKVSNRRMEALAASWGSREALYPTSGTHEVSYALHTRSRIVERFVSPDRDAREAWKAKFDSDWLTGTCDYEGEVLDAPWVDDLKSGRYVPDNPWDLWQLRFYAVCAAMYHNASQVAVSVTHWPRSPADAPPVRIWTPEPVHVDTLLNEILPALEALRREVVRSWDRPDARPGQHCTYCAASNHCPALRGPDSDNPFDVV